MDTQKQIEKFKEFIDAYYKKDIHTIITTGGHALVIDFSLLAQFDPELSEALLEDPENSLKHAEISLTDFDFANKNVRVRITKLPESQSVKIKNIRKDHLGKLMMFYGIVRQSSDVRPRVASAKFECPTCGNNITMLQTEAEFKKPARCSCGYRGGFRLLSKDLVDTQRLVIEESPDTLEGGEQPKRLDVYLKEDLVEPKMEKKTTPGAKVRVICFIKEIPVPSKTGGQSTLYQIVADAVNIEPIEETFEDINITSEDEEKIKELGKDPQIYEKLVASIAPSVFGHEDIKGALVLQLMGGVRKEKSDGTITRGDMHILLVGDPGAAKSTLLIFMTKAAPKARYAAGRGSTGTGLTATVVRDEFLRGWALEGGTLVLANGGFAMIDELDKMTKEDTSSLHEALEQQTITISKANIQATLRTRTTVLAAANPKLGRFDPYQPIAAQIDLPPALINRFDLIFPIRDIPNKEKDTKIASLVLAIQKDVNTINPPIQIAMLKKYVAYVRQRVKPQLTQSAVDEIRDFYVNLRNSGQFGDEGVNVKPIPISARQLEALVRLSEGSARVRLSNKVTKADAQKAINILKACLMQVGFDYETGQIDIDRIQTGVTAATRNKIIIIRDIITAMEGKGKKTIPIEEIMAESLARGLTEQQVEEVLEKMKRSGDLFEPKQGFISKI